MRNSLYVIILNGTCHACSLHHPHPLSKWRDDVGGHVNGHCSRLSRLRSQIHAHPPYQSVKTLNRWGPVIIGATQSNEYFSRSRLVLGCDNEWIIISHWGIFNVGLCSNLEAATALDIIIVMILALPAMRLTILWTPRYTPNEYPWRDAT